MHFAGRSACWKICTGAENLVLKRLLDGYNRETETGALIGLTTIVDGALLSRKLMNNVRAITVIKGIKYFPL